MGRVFLTSISIDYPKVKRANRTRTFLTEVEKMKYTIVSINPKTPPEVRFGWNSKNSTWQELQDKYQTYLLHNKFSGEA